MNTSAGTMVLRDAIYGRRSVRSYTGEKPTAATLRALLDAAVHAPTAIHEEPWQFLVVQDAATLRRLSDRAKELYAAQMRRLHLEAAGGRLEVFSKPDFNVFYDAGTLVVICAKALGQFVVADCWLAAENLMLSAYEFGLGTCVIGSAVAALNSPDVKAEFGIPADVTAVAPIIVGTPAGWPPATARRPAEIIGWR